MFVPADHDADSTRAEVANYGTENRDLGAQVTGQIMPPSLPDYGFPQVS